MVEFTFEQYLIQRRDLVKDDENEKTLDSGKTFLVTEFLGTKKTLTFEEELTKQMKKTNPDILFIVKEIFIEEAIEQKIIQYTLFYQDKKKNEQMYLTIEFVGDELFFKRDYKTKNKKIMDEFEELIRNLPEYRLIIITNG